MSTLTFSKADCEQAILNQIAELEEFIETTEKHPRFLEALDDFRVNLDSWRDYTKTVLQKIFADQSIAKSFDSISSGAFLLVSHDALDTYEGYKSEIKSETAFLRTCIKKIYLFDEPEKAEHFLTAGQQFSAIQIINNIIGKAADSILMIDGYVDQTTLSILSARRDGVRIKILTKRDSAVKPAFKAAAAAFAKQYSHLEIRLTEDYHDRFIIVDSNEIHQVGSSLNHLGGKAATVMQITTSRIRNAILQQAESDWIASTTA